MGVPLNHWFRSTSLRGYASDLLLAKSATERGYFQTGFVRDLLEGRGPSYYVGQDRTGELLWMLLAIEIWHRVFVDGEGRP
jgi:asparagine synthase (glutamine-hydrolysing)